MKFPKVTKRNAGYYLRVWRAERDLSITDAARVFEVSPSFMSLIEAGRRHPDPWLADLFAKATKAPIEIFLNLKNGK